MVTYNVGSTVDKTTLHALGWDFNRKVSINSKEYEEWCCGRQRLVYNQRKHSIKRIYDGAFVGYINHANARSQERLDRQSPRKRKMKQS